MAEKRGTSIKMSRGAGGNNKKEARRNISLFREMFSS